jgi:SAM-dependent methyltransferase
MAASCCSPFSSSSHCTRQDNQFATREMSSRWPLTRLARNWFIAFANPLVLLGIARLPRYLINWRRYNRLTGSETISWKESYPLLTDATRQTPFDAHYFYQACWVARKLSESRPRLHVDIGSSTMAIGVIGAFIPTVFVDYRPLMVKVAGLMTLAGDLLALPFASESLSSLSCLHVIEHVGLGRYGDELDSEGSIKAAKELTRVLAPQGHLLVSAPVGRERVQFNAHRVFAPATVLSMFGDLELIDFAMVDDDGRFCSHASPNQASASEYACGMFEFMRR